MCDLICGDQDCQRKIPTLSTLHALLNFGSDSVVCVCVSVVKERGAKKSVGSTRDKGRD